MRKHSFDLSSASLHILAMVLMLLDHMWASLYPRQVWMTCLGRLAFPIFAFLTAEGFYRTRNLKRYMLRILFFAILSEIPFNLMYSGSLFYPYHQNVLWTFLIALFCMFCLQKLQEKRKLWSTIIFSPIIIFAGFLLATAAMSDYYGTGILTVLTFYYFRKPNWKSKLGQLIVLYFLNVELLGGLCYSVNIGGIQFEIVQQSFALLALVPIWLYQGRKGHTSFSFQLFCYLFYPVHCLILALLALH